MAGPSAVSINRAVPGVSVRVVMQTGCGPYAYVVVDFEPPGPDGGQEFLYTVPDARLPHEFLPAVWEGIREGLGAVAATVLLTDGGFHEVDSRDYGYWLAGREAGEPPSRPRGSDPRRRTRAGRSG
ncbi:hypothetical protein OG239_28945 [Streptomyces sp. NBC_00868]|uniref:hypothetical protein n=1 Tax=unclassified Streptomyces TaxID=2593676 RepID=UPI003250F896|nr:hypothetical protein OG239_28945 [Streptomyces sp. NBC_00868]